MIPFRPVSARAAGHVFVLLAFGFPMASFAESVEMTTYYPAPAGVYKRMTTTDQTILARDRGMVGIGTATPARSLDVAGQAGAQSLVLIPQAAPPANPVEGTLYVNRADHILYMYSNGSWGRMVMFSGEVLGTAVLAADFIETTTNRQVVRLPFRTKTRGLYMLDWSGTQTVAAGAGGYATVIIQRCGSSLTSSNTYDDTDDLPATTDTYDISGAALLNLAPNTNYCFRMLARKKKTSTIGVIRAGATLTITEILRL